jgi:hypothetical protein
MANLDAHNVPHHLYAMPQGSWNQATLLKPTIVERAMADHPDKTIILMDIDCVLSSTADPIALSSGDVSLFVGIKFSKGRKSVVPSSRVIMWRQTNKARELAANWRALCAAYEPNAEERHDEESLMQAIVMTEGMALGIIDKRYSGRDPIDAPTDAVIVHHSAHDASRILGKPRSYVKHLRRQIIGRIIGKPYKQWKYGN